MVCAVSLETPGFALNRQTVLPGLSWTLLGSIANSICQWLAILLIARSESAATLGQYSYALAVCAPIVMLARFNMRTVFATDAINKHAFEQYFTARLVLTCLAAVIVAAYMVGTQRMTIAAIGVSVLLYKSVESLSDMVQGVFQRESWFAALGKSSVLRGATLVICMLLALRIAHNLLAGLLMTGVVWAAIFVFYDLRLARTRQRRWLSSDSRSILKLSLHCLPSGLVLMAAALHMSIPIYVLERYADHEHVGYYASVACFLAVGGVIASALSQSAAPTMATLYASDRRAFWAQLVRLLKVSFVIGALGVAGAALFGSRFLSLLYGPQYAPLAEALVWVAVGTGLSMAHSFLGLTLTIGRLFYEELAITLVSAAVVALFALWAVPKFGVLGATWSMVAGFIMRMSLSAVIIALRMSGGSRSGK